MNGENISTFSIINHRKKSLFVPVNFSKRKIIMFQCRYIGYFPFNRIQFVSYQPRHAPLSHPFYHYPLFYSLSHSSLHFLKHLCIFIRKKCFFLLFCAHLLFETKTSRHSYTICQCTFVEQCGIVLKNEK